MRRPLSITLVAVLFIAAGLTGVIYHASEFNLRSPRYLWILVVRLLPIVGGVHLLRGRNWARWLLVGWLGFHVVLSLFHNMAELAIHALLFAAIAHALFRPAARAYFASNDPQSTRRVQSL